MTAGPTREAVDPVRFLSNRSPGRMGYAIAGAAWRRGAHVTLIAGPSALECADRHPRSCAWRRRTRWQTAVRAALPTRRCADHGRCAGRLSARAPGGTEDQAKEAPEAIALEPAPDILRVTRDARPADLVTVGFALETHDAVANAREKLEAKALDLIVVNDATEPGAGFEVETNRVVILERGRRGGGAAAACRSTTWPRRSSIAFDALLGSRQ